VLLQGNLQALLTQLVVLVRIVPLNLSVGYLALLVELGLQEFFFVFNFTFDEVLNTVL